MSLPEALKNGSLAESDKNIELTPEVNKEANKMFWIVKGTLIPENWSTESILSVYKSYHQRIVNGGEGWVHEDGFEEAWAEREAAN